MSPKQILADWDYDGIVREPRQMRTGTGQRRVGCTLCKGETTVQRRVDHLNSHRIFWTLVDKTDGCWLWMGPLSASGYGKWGHTWTHRASLIAHGGTVPPDWEVDHLCRIRRCVNPAHLEPVTRAENRRRASVTARYPLRDATACRRGHPYTEDNTYRTPRGERVCRVCQRAWRRAWRLRRAA